MLSAALKGYVRSLEVVATDLPPGRERVVPRGTVTMMVNLWEDEFLTYGDLTGGTTLRTSGAFIAGPRTRSSVIDRKDQRLLLRVAFEPGAAAAFLPVPVSEIAEGVVELGDIWGKSGFVLRERLVEAPTDECRLEIVARFLAQRLDARRVPAAVPAAASAIAAGTPVASTAASIGISEWRLRRHFQDAVGLTPKRFGRVRRLHRLLGAIPAEGDAEWARLAHEHGFCDQAHLVNDFHALMGVTPTSYRRRVLSVAHVRCGFFQDA